jgi:hypothetical protein
MTTQIHKLKIEVRGDRLVAACGCGSWQRHRNLDDGNNGVPVGLLLLEIWEEEHTRHAALSANGLGYPVPAVYPR